MSRVLYRYGAGKRDNELWSECGGERALALFLGATLSKMAWRHHALGMLQAEFDESTRIHLWDRRLRRQEMNDVRGVHDHRFRLVSHVLAGSLTDVSYRVTLPGMMDDPPPFQLSAKLADAWEIKHAKIQGSRDHGEPLCTFLGPALYDVNTSSNYTAGVGYEISRREWHTSFIYDFAITVVERFDFDEKPARVLGNPASGIVERTHPDLLDRVIMRAQEIQLNHRTPSKVPPAGMAATKEDL